MDKHFAALSKNNEKAIREAGPRYAPGLDPQAPNLEIEHLVNAIDCLSLSNGLTRKLGDQANALEEAIERTRYSVGPLFRSRAGLLQLLEELRELQTTSTSREIVTRAKKLRNRCNRISNLLKDEARKINGERIGLDTSDPVQRQLSEDLRIKLRDFDEIETAITELLDYLKSSAGQLLIDKNCAILLGSWGTGKTHFLCDVSRARMGSGKPAMLILASNLNPTLDPLDAVAE